MLNTLKLFLESHHIPSRSELLCLAVSGGRDSVCAGHALNKLSIDFVIVHCNFSLRGKESEDDHHFVEALARDLLHCKGFYFRKFNTSQYAKEQGLSIQEAARNLRYAYFDELYKEGIFTKLITAHHASDKLETFFINLYRVSGIRGLSGIPLQRDYVIRPFLEIPALEIRKFIHENNISYREDSSNIKMDYLRNKIRHKILPHIENFLPDFSERSLRSISFIQKENALLDYFIKDVESRITTYSKGLFKIQKKALVSFPQAPLILYRLLYSYGFNFSQCEQILSSSKQESGALFKSVEYDLLIDRASLIIRKRNEKIIPKIEINGPGIYVFGTYAVHITENEKTNISKSEDTELVNIPLTYFPLELRNWKDGDFIQPLGMKGTKLLSDFFTDIKADRFTKNELPLLAKGQEIFWVPGFRISEKIKITTNSHSVFVIKVENANI